MIQKRQAEFPHLDPLDFKIVEPGQKITIGSTDVEFFSVTHSIPDSMGISIETPHGNIIISGDLKLDHHNEVPTKEEKDTWSKIGNRDNILFIADSVKDNLKF